MTFLSPLSLLWLGLLIPLVLLYVLKRRREERTIGSTMLWEQALRDLRAERPWKKLIPQIALLLQILALVAGAFALARPAGVGGVPTGAFVAVVVDASASMAAETDGEARMERARDIADEVARSLPPGGRMLLVEAAAQPSILAPLTGDHAALDEALGRLAVRGGSADLEAAVALAAERLQDAPEGSRVLLLTDAAEEGEVALDGRVPVEVRLVGPAEGAPVENTAIVDADARLRLGEGPDRADLFARVRHWGAGPVDVFLTATIEGRDGVVASRRFTVEPGRPETVVLPATLPPDAAGRAAVVRLALSRVAGGEGMDDDLALDDVAVVPSPGARRLPVFLVGPAPSAVERVLRADPQAELFATSLEQLAERDEDAPPLDGLFVYTGALPAAPPPGDSVVIAPEGDAAFELQLGEEVEAPRVVTWDEADPRLRFVPLAELHLGSLRPLVGGAGRTLVETDAGAAVASIQRPDGETTVLGFDPMRSDWPRQPGFVVFFRNLLERARQRRAAGGVAPGGLGEPLRVPAPDGEEIAVRTPGGVTRAARSRGGLAIVPVDATPGVYHVRAGGKDLFALRSLLDAGESDVRPRLTFTEGGRETEAELAVAREHRESWPWFAGLMLLFLLAEVAWATRRAKRRKENEGRSGKPGRSEKPGREGAAA